MPINSSSTIADIVTRYPLAARVFARHDIDFCCGGGDALAAVCHERGLDLERLLSDIEDETAASNAPIVRWDQAPLAELVDHIVKTYHDPLPAELDRLTGLAAKVAGVHGPKDPARFEGIVTTFGEIRAAIEKHLAKEEEELFPKIRAGQGRTASVLLEDIEADHDRMAGKLRHLRELTDDYAVPEEACNSWRALWNGLEEFEFALHEHTHLENNILHKRARGGE
jgi:regulator of cell morphogenesis and NO signaling